MNIYNNTSNELHYNITSPNTGDCGNLEPGATAEWPSYDNTQEVVVNFSVMSTGTPPFTLNIPKTEAGNVVTIGLYLE